jgi:hypothetical protein
MGYESRINCLKLTVEWRELTSSTKSKLDVQLGFKWKPSLQPTIVGLDV